MACLSKGILLSAAAGNYKNEIKKTQLIGQKNLKLVSTIFNQIFIFSPNDSPLKTMKTVFYFI